MPQPESIPTSGHGRLSSMTYFAGRHPQAATLIAGLLVLLATAGTGILPVSTDPSSLRSFAPLIASMGLGLLVCLSWCWFTWRVRKVVPRSFRVSAYRREPAFAITDVLASEPPLIVFTQGLALGNTLSHPVDVAWLNIAVVLVVILAFLAWLHDRFSPPRLRLTPTGLVTRLVRRTRVIAWDAVFPGQEPTHLDKDGGIWLLVDRSIAERRYDRMYGKSDGPDGYHWVRASSSRLVDPEAFARTTRYYRGTPPARALIGTAAELRRLQG